VKLKKREPNKKTLFLLFTRTNIGKAPKYFRVAGSFMEMFYLPARNQKWFLL